MKRLILIRHAKSDWSDPLLQDHDRVLNRRGRRDAPRIGAWLMQNGYLPDHALCSTAARAVETWDRVQAELPAKVNTSYLSSLYHASAHQMLEALNGATGDCVAMIGHNPGIAALAEFLAEAPPAHPRFIDYPTAATTVFGLDGDWTHIKPGAGRVLGFVIPADLEA